MKTSAAEVIEFLESIAPLSLQEPYDNSGLLIGSPDMEVSGIIVCLDCTEEVLEEAIARGCNMVISHHPAIFNGLKKITGATATERLVANAIRNDLILYAIHTNLDNTLTHGVNERIARTIGLDIEGILRQKANQPNPDIGAGIVGYFPNPVTEGQFLHLLRDLMKTPVIRHTSLINKPIQRVAVCGGSGSFLLEDARTSGVDALVTADFKYHQFFDAGGSLLVCDIGHYESEQFTIRLLQELLSGNFITFAAHCTEVNTNPVHYFT